MLELVVGKEDGTIDNASVPIRWCIDNETLEKAQKDGNMKILIQVKYDHYTEDRFLHKLTSYMTYVPLRRSGDVEICAYIVTAKSKKRSKNHTFNTIFTARSGSKFAYNIDLDRDIGDRILVDWSDENSDSCTIVDKVHDYYKIKIPENVFGAELPKWFDKIVNRYLESKTNDECHRNRRVITFFMFRVWVVAIEALISELRMLSMFFLVFMLGWFHVSLKRLGKPFVDGWNKSGEILAEDVKSKNVLTFFYDASFKWLRKFYPTPESKVICKNVSVLFALMFLPTVPLAYSLYLVISVEVLGIPFNVLALFMPLIINTLLIFVVLLCMSIFVGIVSALIWFWELLPTPNFSIIFKPFTFVGDLIVNTIFAIEKWYNDKFNKNAALKKELLTCNGDANSVTTDIKKIPLFERSPTLIYLDVKNKVCKPMKR